MDPTSPGGDPGKFWFAGRPARLIVHRDGWYLNVNLDWFEGSSNLPTISQGAMHWYVFVFRGPHSRYFICDHHQMRRWVLDFRAPLGRDFQGKRRWRAYLHPLLGADAAVFRWGDETHEAVAGRHDRIIDLDNAAKVLGVIDDEEAAGRPVDTGSHLHYVGGRGGVGGESQAHLVLKRYIAEHPELLGIPAAAVPRIELRFATGDRVDLLFENHRPVRSVVEIEVAGADNVVVGIQQALKYRTLAEVESRYPLLTPKVAAHVAAYKTDYQAVADLAGRYGVNVVAVKPELVLEG